MKEDSENIVVVKFGGSSVADSDKISHAASLVAKKTKEGKKVIVVISAIGKTTDQLVKLTNGSSFTGSPKHMDEVLAMGERTSCRVFNLALSSHNLKSDFLDIDDADWPIITDNTHGSANIILEKTRKNIKETISKKFKELDILIVPGFIGKSNEGETTTIGRGGSDATAYVIADSLGVKEVILVSDVEGIMTADPKVIKNPELIDKIHVDKLVGLADSGVKFMHKRALAYKPDDVSVKLISNTSESLDVKGTIIIGSMSDLEVDIISKNEAGSITIVGQGITEKPKTLSDILRVLHDLEIPLYGMSADHGSIVMYLEEKGINKAMENLHSIVIKSEETLAIARRNGLSVLRINGIGLQETPGSISRAATILRKNGINIFGQYTVMSQIFLLVEYGTEKKAKELIEKELGGEVNGQN